MLFVCVVFAFFKNLIFLLKTFCVYVAIIDYSMINGGLGVFTNTRPTFVKCFC